MRILLIALILAGCVGADVSVTQEKAYAVIDAEEVASRIVTMNQLITHSQALRALLYKAHTLLELEEADDIDLTADQKTALLAEYTAYKTLITSTYGDLP